MTLTKARRLRDFIRGQDVHAVVPLGHGPDGYFVRITTSQGPLRLDSPSEWNAYCQRERDKITKFCEDHGVGQRRLERPRSPLDAMIDAACGVKEGDYR